MKINEKLEENEKEKGKEGKWMKGKGLFITIEGPDGAGKTTQIQGLTAFLQEQEIPSLVDLFQNCLETILKRMNF